MYGLKPKGSRVHVVDFLLSFEFSGDYFIILFGGWGFYFLALEIVSVVKQGSRLIWVFYV